MVDTATKDGSGRERITAGRYQRQAFHVNGNHQPPSEAGFNQVHDR
jgi:hypothetical protein